MEDLAASNPAESPASTPAPEVAAAPPRPRRIPNLLHLLLFLVITFFAFVFCEGILLGLHTHDLFETMQNQRLQLFVNIGAWIVALGASALVFPLLWHRSFASGVSWNFRRKHLVLIAAGLALGFIFQGASSLLPVPKSMPIEQIFNTPGIIWTLVLFGTLIAPVFEEMLFRGFMLPGIAIAVDYLRLPKSVEALDAWRVSDCFSMPALITSSLITSVCFASIHAPQLGFSWPAVSLLVCVSLVLCFIRIRQRSVAASTIVHACYNFSVFLTLFATTGGFRHMDRM